MEACRTLGQWPFGVTKNSKDGSPTLKEELSQTAGAAGAPSGRRVTENPTRTLKRDLKRPSYLGDVLGKCSACPSRPKPNEVAGFRKPSTGWPPGAGPSRESPGGPSRHISSRYASSLRLSSWGSGSRVSGLRCCEPPFLSHLVFLSSPQPRTEAATRTDDFNLPRPVFSFKMCVIVPVLQVISSFSLCPHLLLFKIVHQIPYRMCMFEVSSAQPFTNLLLIKKG